MWNLLVCLCAIVVSAACQSEESRVVNTTQGPIRGYRDPDGDVFSFYDVPYATAPNGTDRFKAPLPPPSWITPYEAVQRRISCPQPFVPNMNIQEDCLVANIYAPSAVATNLSVLVYIHGGGYQIGHGHFVALKNFVRTNTTIVVAFNYRLGAHGFLCLGTEKVPGNAGLKDQVALLRWVQNNIASFGGNPDDVTIMGCSAGGASVDLMTLSNITRGLFHKAIPESGCSFGAIGVQSDPTQNAKVYARMLNFTNVDDLNALEEFYLTTPYETLVLNQNAILGRPDSGIIFGPCVERNVGVEMFLVDDPSNTMTKGDFPAVPMLYGLADMEGLFRLPQFYDWSERMNRNFSDFLPQELEFESGPEKEAVAAVVKEAYFGDRPIDGQTILEYIDFFSDVMFRYRMMKALTLRLEARQQSIYLFEYSFVDENTPVIPYTVNSKGADHCGQMYAVFDEDKTNVTAAYRDMKTLMRSFWMNFIVTSNPAPEGSSLLSWPAVNISRFPYMSLGTTVELRNTPFGTRFQLWDEIYHKHYRPAIPPRDIPDSATGAASNVFIISILVICNYLA